MQGIAAFPPGPRPPRTLESRTVPGTKGCTVVAISKDRNTHRLPAEITHAISFSFLDAV